MKWSDTACEPLPQCQSVVHPVKVALVLGGGGSKGLAHVGVLYELEAAGIHPDLIVGCSSGAIVGVLYADHPSVDRLRELLIPLKRSDLLDFSLFAPRFAVVKGTLLRAFLHRHLQATCFEQLKIPFIAVATDLLSGELVELGGGEIIPAIHASAAVPGVFAPVKYYGRYLIDGGTTDPIPVKVAKRYGSEVIIAVDVGADLSRRAPSHLFHVAQRSLAISHRSLSEYVTQQADIVIRMNFKELGTFSDQYNWEIYERGREVTREMIPHIQALIARKLAQYRHPGRHPGPFSTDFSEKGSKEIDENKPMQ